MLAVTLSFTRCFSFFTCARAAYVGAVIKVTSLHHSQRSASSEAGGLQPLNTELEDMGSRERSRVVLVVLLTSVGQLLHAASQGKQLRG